MKKQSDVVSKQKKSLWVFFLSCLKISAFTLGGGYVIVPLQKRKFSDELGWIEEEKIMDFVAIAQSAPGPIAINASTLMGYHLFGLRGALTAIVATVLPPLIILSIISAFYKFVAENAVIRAVLKGMQSAVAGLVLYTVFNMALNVIKTRSMLLISLLILCLTLVILTDINVVYILLIAAVVSIIAFTIDSLTERGH